MPLDPATRLGTYEIVGPLGAGGMGEVYRAKDLRLGRDIALKVLPANVASHTAHLARIEREARTVAGLNHPNIVTLHSVEDADGIRFLTMELVEGQSLADLVTPGGLPLERVLDMSIAIADALTAAHEKGIVHRDLKPANVMVTRDGRVKVLDFGLAKMTPVEPDLETTQAATMAAPLSAAGEVMGTAPYMAPEQVRGQAVDARTDLFSFGILVYELASGKRPFTGPTFADVSSAILRDTPPLLTIVRPDIPSELARIIGRCLEKQPHERIQTSLDVANELRGLKRSLERGGAPTPMRASDRVASIAVLPFVNRSANVDDEYFSDGLADELLNVLAKIRGLRVVARTSAFTFKGKEVTIGEIGRALNVATVLEGSVRKAGPQARISVQLVNVSDGYHLWSETYDRTLDDIFAVQDDIARSVVKELRATLLGEEVDSKASGEVKAEVSKALKGRGTHPEAHRLYLQARHLMERLTREGTTKAIEYLKQALELEPEFALAWVHLAGAYRREADNVWAPFAEGYARAREAVERALALEPDLAEAHSAMMWIQMIHDWDWRGAEHSRQRALELGPGNVSVLRSAGSLALARGPMEEAIGLYRRALDCDPLSILPHQSLAHSLALAGRHVEAEEVFRKALALAPQAIRTRSLFSLTLLALGRGEEALVEAAAEPEPGLRFLALAIIHHVLRMPTESDAALQKLIEVYAEVGAYQIAEVYAARGESHTAFAWLERAYAQRDGGLAAMRTDPWLRTLHSDPRWDAFLKKMRFEKLGKGE